MARFNWSHSLIDCCTPDCPDRKPGCHGYCKRYAEKKALHNKRKLEYEGPSELRQYVAEQNAKHRDHVAKACKKNSGRKTPCD